MSDTAGETIAEKYQRVVDVGRALIRLLEIDAKSGHPVKFWDSLAQTDKPTTGGE